MKIVRSIAILVYLLAILGCSSVSKQAKYEYAGKTPDQLFVMAEKYMLDGKYANAVKIYEHLESTYPFGPHAQQTELNIIYAYYMNNNPGAAKAAAERYIHLYPQAKDVDYAYYMRALASLSEERTFAEKHLPIDLSQRDLANAHKSYDEFSELTTRFPQSRYLPDARQHMVYLRNMFAQNDVNVAEFYLERKAYVAAVNRAYNVVKNYQQSPQTADALEILVQAYKGLGLTTLSNNALQTLALNYPNSKQYRIARGDEARSSKDHWYKFW